MADYPGSNDEKTMEGNEKQVYAGPKKRFSKLKKLIKTCK
jgi:hypothetical protein